MKARIIGKGNKGCMKNFIELNVFDALFFKNLVQAAINKAEWEGSEPCSELKEFLSAFDSAFTAPSKMDESNVI